MVVAARDRRIRAIAVGEINPMRSAGAPTAIARFVNTVARVSAAVAS